MIRCALLGCGRIAKRHAELLGAGQIVGARRVAVCDVDRRRAGAFSNHYGVPGFTSLAILLKQPDIDAIAVLTLPILPEITPAQLQAVVDAIRSPSVSAE